MASGQISKEYVIVEINIVARPLSLSSDDLRPLLAKMTPAHMITVAACNQVIGLTSNVLATNQFQYCAPNDPKLEW